MGPTFEDLDLDRAADLLRILRPKRAAFFADMKVLEPGHFWGFGRRDGNLEFVVGPVALALLVEHASISTNLPSHVAIVRQMAILRKLRARRGEFVEPEEFTRAWRPRIHAAKATRLILPGSRSSSVSLCRRAQAKCARSSKTRSVRSRRRRRRPRQHERDRAVV